VHDDDGLDIGTVGKFLRITVIVDTADIINKIKSNIFFTSQTCFFLPFFQQGNTSLHAAKGGGG